MGEAREDLGDSLAGVLAGGDGGQLGMRMSEEQADKFLAGITGGADDGDFGFRMRGGGHGRMG